MKPDNIIVTADFETAYLVDFGIALSTTEGHRITDSGWVVGTPGYISPEQQSGDELDPRSDVFSLGVTLYEALAGKMIPQGGYEPLSIQNEAIPRQVDDLIQNCLPPKDQRIRSAHEFSQRLSGALKTDRPISFVLSDGSLADLSLAIQPLDPDQFAPYPLVNEPSSSRRSGTSFHQGMSV